MASKSSLVSDGQMNSLVPQASEASETTQTSRETKVSWNRSTLSSFMELHLRIFLLTVAILDVCKGEVRQNWTVWGCGPDLDSTFRYLCDRSSAWGIIVQALTALGFLVSASLLLALLLWLACTCGRCRRRSPAGGSAISTVMFLLAVTGIFALPFSFIIGLTEHTCLLRVFLFGVLFGLAFSCLLARSLALLGWGASRPWGEPGTALLLVLVQVVVAGEWLLMVLVREGQPCSYRQAEFVILLIYVMLLLLIAMILSLHHLCQVCTTYGYGNTGRARRRRVLRESSLFLTLLLSAGMWVVWITLLTWGNKAMHRRPTWDDPVLSIALTANGWVLLLGQGVIQIQFLFCCQMDTKHQSTDFTAWTTSSAGLTLPGLINGTDNKGYQQEHSEKKGKWEKAVLRSPYQPKFSKTEFDPGRVYSIPRPQTTNTSEPYDDYYRHRVF